ncbi:short-chain dehydrogenase [Mycena capillaripes]|nr:short-chain dehydrogenase [Mycena capillaripes]
MDYVLILKQVASWKWISDQYTHLDIPASDLIGKTVVLTGANRGLGFEAAKHFAHLNVERLILGCRNIDAGNAAAQEIKDTTGCRSVTCWPLDVASFTSISEFATRIRQENVSVDILVGNAAYMPHNYVQTRDGWETGLQVNCLGNFLLTLLLLPHFSRASEAVSIPRVVLLSSVTHYFMSRIQEADAPKILAKLNDPQHCSDAVIQQRYFVSKVLIILFARELARRIDPKVGPTIVTVDPGYCSTSLYQQPAPTLFGRVILRVNNFLLARTPEMGSRTIIHAAVSGKSGDIHGEYMNTLRVERPSDFVMSAGGAAVQQRLWDEVVETLQQADSRVENIVRSLRARSSESSMMFSGNK